MDYYNHYPDFSRPNMPGGGSSYFYHNNNNHHHNHNGYNGNGSTARYPLMQSYPKTIGSGQSDYYGYQHQQQQQQHQPHHQHPQAHQHHPHSYGYGSSVGYEQSTQHFNGFTDYHNHMNSYRMNHHHHQQPFSYQHPQHQQTTPTQHQRQPSSGDGYKGQHPYGMYNGGGINDVYRGRNHSERSDTNASGNGEIIYPNGANNMNNVNNHGYFDGNRSYTPNAYTTGSYPTPNIDSNNQYYQNGPVSYNNEQYATHGIQPFTANNYGNPSSTGQSFPPKDMMKMKRMQRSVQHRENKESIKSSPLTMQTDGDGVIGLSVTNGQSNYGNTDELRTNDPNHSGYNEPRHSMDSCAVTSMVKNESIEQKPSSTDSRIADDVGPETKGNGTNESTKINDEVEMKPKPAKKKRKIKKKNRTEPKDESKNIVPLPGFLQTFGSTEIGRFSEKFFISLENPNEPNNKYENDVSTQLWEVEMSDSLDGPQYSLTVGATVQPAYADSIESNDSPQEKNVIADITCKDS